MQAAMIRPITGKEKAGRLAIVGTGITAIAHLSQEAIAHIKNADIVFYNATSGVAARQIHELNPNAIDLYEYYGEGKNRSATYIQMAELMLREVRKGLAVAGVFHGHPGFFVKPGRRALAIAEMEGYETHLLAGISSTDCLFADLRIDPGVIGVQILKASTVLHDSESLVTKNHVLLVQVGSVGDNTFSFTGYKRTKIEQLFEKLISIYGDRHDSVYYVAAIFPGLSPTIHVRKLGEYRNRVLSDAIHAATLYLPPAGVSFDSLTSLQAFHKHEPYGDFERKAIEELDTHTTPPGYKFRLASRAMMRVMYDVVGTPAVARKYSTSPADFVADYSGLLPEERHAIVSRDVGYMRSAASSMGGAQPDKLLPTTRLGMRWAPDQQSIYVGSQSFTHDGAISTAPSHDLTHLLIAANGNLRWVPEGERNSIKLAEYNAIFLEHLFDAAYNAAMSGNVDDDAVFSRSVGHARWFVEKHFAPFPISAEEAYSKFCWHINGEAVVRLAPYFFHQKQAERENTNFLNMKWALDFCVADRPKSLGKCLEFQDTVSRQVRRLRSFAAQ
jgi:precorrin-2 methylase